MRMTNQLKRLATLLCGVLLFTQLVSAQNLTVKGKVLDSEKQPVIGAAVMQAGTSNGAACDVDGNFTITVPAGAELVVSAMGYETLHVKVTSSTMNITLLEESTELEETVVVGYGTQKKASLTSAITNIQSDDITATKQSDLVSSLQGKVPGLQIRQGSGNVGWFDQEFSLRGYGAPLVIIDGVARQSKSRLYYGWAEDNSSSTAALGELNPEDIESITVLKDASASIYGLGAQNGVILVTTKKGQVGKPSISYSNTLTIGVPTALPKETDVATFLEMTNEIYRNTRKKVLYSDELIEHYRNGDPGYVDFSYFDAVYKSHTFSQVHNLSIRGGNQQTQYYLSANLNKQDAIYRSDNGDWNRYGFTGNFTSKLTQNLSVSYQAAINFVTQSLPWGNTVQNALHYVLDADRTIPMHPLDNPDHWSLNGKRNIVALLDPEVAGTDKDRDITMRNNLDFKYEAPFLKGLTLQASAAFDVVERKKSHLIKPIHLYDYRTDEYKQDNKDTPAYSETWNQYLKYYGRIQANYSTTIARDHHLNATLAAETTINTIRSLNAAREFGDFYTHDTIDQGDKTTATNSGSRSSSAAAGYIARVNYDYKGKYLVELMGRYDGSYLYAPGHRWGLFPSYSLGWRVSEEKFFKKMLPFVNNFKLRWSDGMTGQAQGSAYGYLPGYAKDATYVFDDGKVLNGYASHSTPETILSWTRVRMMDFGIDFEAWRGLFGGTIDWFWRNTSGIAAASTATVPDFYGISLPKLNLDKSQNVGIDLSLYHRNQIGDFSYRVMFTATFSRYRTTYSEKEKTAIYNSSVDYFNNHSVGRWSNAHSNTTYHWLPGNPQFTSWADIADSHVLYGNMNNMLPGMYKIEDRNQDGVINSNDYYYTWAETNPPLQMGLVLSGKWKGLDFNITFNSATLVYKNIGLSGGMGYGRNGTFYQNHMDRWHTAEYAADPFDPQTQWVAGYWPALAYATSAYDTSSNVTYRAKQPYTYINGTYLRLKSLEVGYTFDMSFLRKLHLRTLRVYVNGSNLLTFCDKLLKPYDPEREQNSYIGTAGSPLMRNFSAGINLNF